MTPTNLPHNHFPPPYRAPGPAERPAQDAEESELAWGGDRDDRRYQRAIDGWVAGRIRKQARHWRPR
jgi:hypothetical protein